MKQCVKCIENKPYTDFAVDKHNKDGYTYNCKKCRALAAKLHPSNSKESRDKKNLKHKEKRKEYYSKPENKLKFKDQTLRRTFGIGIEDYNILFINQNGLCAICNNPQVSTRNKSLAIDHSHKSGKIRGLLCDNCNRAIGLLKDDIAILKSAIRYLEGNND